MVKTADYLRDNINDFSNIFMLAESVALVAAGSNFAILTLLAGMGCQFYRHSCTERVKKVAHDNLEGDLSYKTLSAALLDQAQQMKFLQDSASSSEILDFAGSIHKVYKQQNVELRASRDEVAELQLQLKSQTEKVLEDKRAYEELQNVNKSQQEEHARLIGQLKEKGLQIEGQTAAIDATEKQMKELQQQRETFQSEATSVKQENERLKGTLCQYENRIRFLMAQNPSPSQPLSSPSIGQ